MLRWNLSVLEHPSKECNLQHMYSLRESHHRYLSWLYVSIPDYYVWVRKKAPPLRNSLWRNKLVPFPPDCSSSLQQQLRLWSTPLHILSGAAALDINLFSYLGCKQDLNSGCNMCRDNSKHHFTSTSDFFSLFSTDGQDANEWLWSDPCVYVIDSKPLILTDAWKKYEWIPYKHTEY